MVRKCIVACAIGLCVSTSGESVQAALPMSTAFTFQGQLKDGGIPADGTYDLQFRLYDSLSDGAQIGNLLTKVAVVVDHGLFTVTLDFGSSAFAGQQRWLEVAVRESGGHGAPFTILSPRQAVTASPYALYALAGPGGGGYWAGSGDDIHNTNAANVGIGTDAPADELHVGGTNPTLRVQDDSDPGSYTVLQDDGSTNTAQLEKRVGSGVPTVEISPMPIDTVSDARIRFFRRTNTSGAKVVLFNRGRNTDSVSALIGVDGYDSWFQADGGNFGIGTSAPAHPLHLSSSAQIMEKVTSSHTAGTWLDLENTSTGGKRWGIVSTGSANGEGAGNLLLRAITDGRTVMTLKGTGDVGIGTTSPQARLHVDGGTETALGGGGYLQIGRTESTNISFDDNEIQARILGVAAPLLVNPAGGSIHMIQSGTGRVGIGTSSPDSQVKLDVVTSGSETAIHGRGGAVGVGGWGSHSGGYFRESDGTGEVWLGTNDPTLNNENDVGVFAQSAQLPNGVGGTFVNGHGTIMRASMGTSSTSGNGAKHFVQNHPFETDRVIVYTSLEGDEVGTYSRGTGRLVDGEARVALGETFKWVTNPDIGLTAHVTPRDQAVPLAVVSLTTDELVVRGPENGPSDVAFDYVVHGLRIGFEQVSVLQYKTMDARIPSMALHEEAYANDPDLRQFNAFERFKSMGIADGRIASLDLSRAEALRDAITVYDPAIHQMPHPPRPVALAQTGQLELPLHGDEAPQRDDAAVVPHVGDNGRELEALRDKVEALERLVLKLQNAGSGTDPK